MKDPNGLFIEGTSKTPQIDFNSLSGELILFGKSIPENAAKVYEPPLLWIDNYIKSPRKITNLRLHLEYFNSATSIWIAKLVKALSKIEQEDSVLFVHLYFDLEDYEALDTEDLKDIVTSIIGNLGTVKVSIGIKYYGTDDKGNAIKESTILI
jgi:hypothetical protein